MNFCEDFSNIQSIFNYCNEFVKPLHKIQIRGGNEIYIDEIVGRLRRYFVSKNYTTNDNEVQHQLHETELRKITFYLILNTEATFKFNLSEDYNIVHVLGTIPQISKMLLLSLVWELNLNCYFYECISYSPIWFSLQFIEMAVDSLKFADSHQVLDRIDKLVCAIYLNISRSDYRVMGIVDKKIILGKYFDHTMDFLRHFFTPDAEKFSNFTKFKYSLYSGHVLKHILRMIIKCFALYKTKPEMDVEKKFLIYSLMSAKDNVIDNHSNVYSEPVDETLHKINTALLNSLQYNVMMVNIDTFINWVEEDVDEDHTLQNVVGEAAYHVMNLIRINECFKHDVQTQLESISIKPLTLEEITRKATIGEILNKLDNMSSENDTRQAWLTEFVSRGILVFENDECMETLEQNIQHLSIANVLDILKYIKSVDDIEDNVKELIVKSIDNFTMNDLNEIILSVIDMQSQMNRTLELEDYSQSLIEIFNKTTQTLYSQIAFKIMVQNPMKFYETIFKRALQNEQEIVDLIKFIVATDKISVRLIENELKNLFEIEFDEFDGRQRETIPKFIGKLFYANLISKPQFIQNWLYKPLNRALIDKKYSKILCLLKSFLIISHKFDFEKLCPPVLVMCGQVLDQCRWDIVKYTEELENIVIISIDVLREVMKKFLPVANEQDKKWILSKTASLKPITRYYFHKLSLNRSETPAKLDYFIFGSDIDQLSHSEVIAFLSETFIRCTKKETEWLAQNQKLYPYFKDVMVVLFEIVKRTNNINSINCLRHCMLCYIKIVRDFIANCATSSFEKIDLIKQQFQVFEPMQAVQIYDELLLNSYPMMLEIFERFHIDIKPSQMEFRNSIVGLADCEAKTTFLSKFDEIFE